MKKIIILSSFVLLVAASCNTTTVQQPQTNNQPASQNTKAVSIQSFAFSPSSITIKKGETVTWTNKDSVAHTVTGDNGGPNSADLNTDQTYSFTFDTAGTFNYHCAIHPSMKGTVVVTE